MLAIARNELDPGGADQIAQQGLGVARLEGQPESFREGSELLQQAPCGRSEAQPWSLQEGPDPLQQAPRARLHKLIRCDLPLRMLLLVLPLLYFVAPQAYSYSLGKLRALLSADVSELRDPVEAGLYIGCFRHG